MGPEVCLFAKHGLNKTKIEAGHTFYKHQQDNIVGTYTYLVNNKHGSDTFTYHQPSGTAFSFIAHKGDCTVNAEKGAVRISGKQIVLEASREIIIQSPKIRIGYEEENKTKDVKIIGQEVDIQAKKGPLADSLLSSTMIKAFTGTLVTDLAIAGSASPVASAVNSIVGGQSNVLGISFGGISASL